jgi:hypothetical protein
MNRLVLLGFNMKRYTQWLPKMICILFVSVRKTWDRETDSERDIN